MEVVIYYDEGGNSEETFKRNIPCHSYEGEDLLRHVMGCAWGYPQNWFRSPYWVIGPIEWRDDEVIFDLLSHESTSRKHIRITGCSMGGPW